MLALFWFLCSAVTSAAAGQWDYFVDLRSRAYPLAAIVNGTVGYGHLLWGEREPIGKQWLYGYIRPSLSLQTIGILSRSEAQLDLHPISIVGISVGRHYAFRTSLYSPPRCETLACGGVLGRTVFQLRLLGGAKGFFVVPMARIELLDHSNNGSEFVDEMTRLRGQAGGDELVTFEGVAGYKIDDHWLAGATISYSRVNGTRENRRFGIGLAQYQVGRWSVAAGAGYYSATIDQLGPTAVLLIKWTGEKSVGLLN